MSTQLSTKFNTQRRKGRTEYGGEESNPAGRNSISTPHPGFTIGESFKLAFVMRLCWDHDSHCWVESD